MAKVRGFLGDYTIEVRAGSKTKTVPAKLTKGGTRVEIELYRWLRHWMPAVSWLVG